MNMTVDEIITELTMSASYEIHVLLEGASDKKLYESIFNNKKRVNCVDVNGSNIVIDVIKEIENQNTSIKIRPTMGIIDIDYRIPLDLLPNLNNLFLTDYRDIECMMFNSPVFDIVLNEYGSENKIRDLGGNAAISSLVIGVASKMGKLRFYSQKNELNVSFKNLDFCKFLNKKSLEYYKCIVNYINSKQDHCSNKLPHNSYEQAELVYEAAINTNGEKYFSNPLLLCRGHDLMEILAIGFRYLFGSKNVNESNCIIIESAFRIGYVSHFKNSDLGQKINFWIKKHELQNIIYLS